MENLDSNYEKHYIKKGRDSYGYVELYCGFDIETTQIESGGQHLSFMYNWQFSINSSVIMGKTWDKFIQLLDSMIQHFNLSKSSRIIVFVANLGYEWQFMRKWLTVTDSFLIDSRQPLMVTHRGCIEFRDALLISGGSLAYLAKNYTTTQKMIGDLDYKKLRNSTTKLTEKELKYCVNDVVILSEYSQFIFNTFIKPLHFIPSTKTSIIRRQVKEKAFCKQNKDVVKKAIQICYPNENLYRLIINWLFRGGYVHSSALYTNMVVNNMKSYDYESSYPNVMNHAYFPVGKFINKKIKKSEYEIFNKKYCTIAVITFYNIKKKTIHSIESKNKIINSKGAIYDNGRLIKANEITVCITELDYLNYKDFYNWSDFEIQQFYYTIRGKLPKYLLSVLNSNFETKSKLKQSGKKDTQEYALSKENVNSNFGMTVTHLYEKSIKYDPETESYYTDLTFNFDLEKDKQFLLPQWGVWITAHARRNLLEVVRIINEDVVYCDTDSIKLVNYENWGKFFFDYNKKVRQRNYIWCQENNYDYKLFKNLGTFEDETKGTGIIKRFKTCGAKRYIYETEKEGIKTTISGLNKKVLVEYCNSKKLDVFEFFSDDMEIPSDSSKRLTSEYHDEPTKAIIDGEIMQEKSSVSLYETTFTMSMDNYYLEYLNTILEEVKKNG